jgi:general secretion pathway protein J
MGNIQESAKLSANNRGFTLIELLLSISLIVIIVAIVGGAIRLGYRSSDAGEKKIDSLERLRMSFRIIDAQLQSEIPLTREGENGREYYFKGDEKTLQFSTNYSVWDGRRGYVMVLYRIEPDGYGKQVMHISENTIGSEIRRETRLFDALDDISFEYFKKDALDEGSWMPEWAETNDIPQKVRINLAQGTKKYSIIIPMRAAGSLIKTAAVNPAG